MLCPAEKAEEFPDLSAVPSEYLDLKQVFNKSRAISLLPHRPYDCAIDLILGTTPPRGRLYPLSGPERQANYIAQALATELIRPTSYAGGIAFYFVGKKDGELRLCINYRGLNTMTVKD